MLEYARLNENNEVEFFTDLYHKETVIVPLNKVVEKLNFFYELNHHFKSDIKKLTEYKEKKEFTKNLYEADRNKLLLDFKNQQEQTKNKLLKFLQELLTSVDKIFLNSINPGLSPLEKSANTYTELTNLINSKIIEIETTALNQDKGEIWKNQK